MFDKCLNEKLIDFFIVLCRVDMYDNQNRHRLCKDTMTDNACRERVAENLVTNKGRGRRRGTRGRLRRVRPI